MGTVTAPVAGIGLLAGVDGTGCKPDCLVVKDFFLGSPVAVRYSLLARNRERRAANSVFLYPAFENFLRQNNVRQSREISVTTRFPAPSRFRNFNRRIPRWRRSLSLPSTPSRAASSFTMPKAWSSVTIITSSQTERSKFPGIKLLPMPSTLCGPGFASAQDRALVSTATACTFASRSLRKRATPVKVPRFRSRSRLASMRPFHLFKDSRAEVSCGSRRWRGCRTARP